MTTTKRKKSTMQWSQFLATVSSGVAVATVIAFCRLVWTHRRVPFGLSRRVGRRGYLTTVLSISRGDEVEQLEAVVPNLRPAGHDRLLVGIQGAWGRINGRLGAQFVTGVTKECLTAGAELLSKGMQVRVDSGLSHDDLSYHYFGGGEPQVVVNNQDHGRNRPIRLAGASQARIFRSHFKETWQTSVPLESVLASEALGTANQRPDHGAIADRIRDLRVRYNLAPAAEEAVLRHIAFRHSAPVIFVTGLPGAGKSLVRRRLAAKLSALRFQVDEQSDYVYAFSDFLRSVIMLDMDRPGFSAEMGGAFRVDNERRLEPALQALAKHVWANTSLASITLVEFARADVIAALRIFGDEVLSRAQVIHVRASTTRRETRLAARAQPPQTLISSTAVNVMVSDDHRLPSTVAKSLYGVDNITRLSGEKILAGRVHRLDNELDDPTLTALDQELDSFVEDVVRPYKVLAP